MSSSAITSNRKEKNETISIKQQQQTIQNDVFDTNFNENKIMMKIIDGTENENHQKHGPEEQKSTKASGKNSTFSGLVANDQDKLDLKVNDSNMDKNFICSDSSIEKSDFKDDSDEISNSNLNSKPTIIDHHQKKQNQKMIVLLKNFTDEQFSRYEMYRRSKFSKPTIKKLVKHLTGQVINEKTAIALAGIAKVFVGQLIETALDYQERLGENGPLMPKHIREANRLLRLQKNSTPFKACHHNCSCCCSLT